MASKRINKAKEHFKKTDILSVEEGLNKIFEYGEKFQAKFDESVDMVFKLSIDPLKSNQLVRGAVNMPHGLGKKIRIMAIVESKDVDLALKSGADYSGAEDMIEKIEDGFLEFDVCISTPTMMKKLSKVAKILGPKGLMPNPKLGTVAEDVNKAIADSKKGRANFKSDKGALVHCSVGKLSLGKNNLMDNINAFYNELVQAKPEKIKGDYIKRCHINTSQGVSLELDLKSFMV